ncbi:Lipase [Globisporangium polare]
MVSSSSPALSNRSAFAWLSLLLALLLVVSSSSNGASALNAVQEEDEGTSAIDADAGLTVKQLVQKRGYAVEEHNVTTADRYVLTMYRLPKSFDETQKNASAAPNKPAVYLIHGLLDSSYTFVLNYRTQSLAYILADAGYDVWLGNNRGTTWSRGHLDYTTKDDAFWDFTFEDMGKYDLPAMINYVLNTSKRPTLSYIGHSEGTMQAFAGFSLNQEVAQRVSYFGALAPVAYVGSTTSPVFIALAKTYLDKLFELLGLDEFFGKTPILQDIIGKYGCAFVDVACDSIINALTGPSENVNKSRIHVYISQTPAGTSVKNMGHFAQGIRDNTFRQYDYGCKCSTLFPITLCPKAFCKNKEVYGTFEPPAFDLSKMKYPRTAFFTGEQDWLATSNDIQKLRASLPAGTIIADTSVPFNHLDFTWAFNAADKIYHSMIAQMTMFEGIGYSSVEAL